MSDVGANLWGGKAGRHRILISRHFIEYRRGEEVRSNRFCLPGDPYPFPSQSERFFPNLADHEHGDPVALSVSDDAVGLGVVYGLPINEELIWVAPVGKLDRNVPGAIDLALHWMGLGIPVIKVAGEKYCSGLRSQANKMNRLASGLRHHTLR